METGRRHRGENHDNSRGTVMLTPASHFKLTSHMARDFSVCKPLRGLAQVSFLFSGFPISKSSKHILGWNTLTASSSSIQCKLFFSLLFAFLACASVEVAGGIANLRKPEN